MEECQLPHHHHEEDHEALGNIPGASDFQIVSSLFKQLADPNRLRIFWVLCHYEECVINISALMDMSSPAVAHHLRLLRQSGLLESRREGKEVYYKAASNEAAQALHTMIETMMEISCPDKTHPGQFDPEQVRRIRSIHKLMTEHLETRYTIEELSRLYLLNTSSLKAVFKGVYGQPIASYMKEYRIKKAMELLRAGGKTIAQVAAQVGYENQGKFTKAFKEYTAMTPSDFLKNQ